MTDKRTMLGWFEYLDDRKRELTLSEFMALMLFNTREYARQTKDMAKEQKEATEHLEGMVGTLDEWLAGDDRYRKIADKRSRPVPMLPEQEAS